MKAAKFPLHRDLAGLDFEAPKVDQKLVKQLSTLDFTDTAQNAVLIDGPGAYFSPSWTAFQADRGRYFSVIVDGVSN